MVDLPDWTPETATAEAPQSRISEGAVERSADAIPEGLDKLGQGLEDLATPIAAQEGSDAASKISITRNPDGAINVATPANSFIMGQAGDAYAEAATQGTLAKLHTKIDMDMVDMAQQFKTDPTGFRNAAGNYLSDLSSSGNPAFQHAAEYGGQVMAQHYDGLVDTLGRIDTQSSYQAQKERLDYIENGMDGLAAQGGTDTPQFKAWANERNSILGGFVANPLYGYNSEMRSVDDDRFQTRMTSAAAVGAARNVYQQTHNLMQATQVLNDKIDALPMSQTDKIRLQGEITEHMRGMDAVWQQENDNLRNTARTVVTQWNAEGRADPQQAATLVGQLNARKLYAEAANVEGSQLFLQYKPSFNPDGTAAGWATAYQGLQNAVNKETQGVIASGPVPLSPRDRDLVIRTIAGEAGGESETGQQGVAAVIRNRVLNGSYGANAGEVVLSPSQFSVWNSGDPAGNIARGLRPGSPQYERIGELVDGIFSGHVADPTHGADHYYNPANASPAWGDQLAQTNDVTIGNHRFVGGSGAPQQSEVAPALNVYLTKAQDLYNSHFKDVWAPMKEAFDKGQMPSTQEIADLKTLAPYVTDNGLLNDVGTRLKVAGEIQSFKALPIAQQQDLAATSGILAARGGLDAINRQVAGQMSTVADHSANLAKNDAVSYAYYSLPTTVQKTLPSLDFDVTQPQQLAAGLKAGQAWKNAAHNLDPSVTSQGVLTDVKRDQLAAAMPGMNAQQVGGTLQAFSALQPSELQAEVSYGKTKDAIVGLTRSGDYGKMNAAYSFLDQLQRRNPAQFESTFGGDTFKNLRVWQAKSAFEPPDQIAREMTQADDPSMQKAKDALRDQADTQLKAVTTQQVAQKFGNGLPFIGRTPDMMTATPAASLEAMRQDYAGFYRDMYAEVGDANKADAYAVERLGQKYGVSNVNGDRLMAYPPDKTNADGTGTYYPKVNGGFDYIGDQLNRSVGIIADSILPRGDDDEAYAQSWRNFVAAPRALVGDTTTQAEVASGRPPSYQIVMQDPKTGNIRVLADPATGKPYRFRPDAAAAQNDARAAFAVQRQADASAAVPEFAGP